MTNYVIIHIQQSRQSTAPVMIATDKKFHGAFICTK